MLKDKLITEGGAIGKYRIEARVAEGGMGVFWRALDTRLDRTVGIKTLHTEFAVEPQLRDRFINEARALAKLNHPNICVLHDFFESGDQLYIVMEYIQGETLADMVRHKGALTESEIVPIFRQILLALDYAHGCGVIHRDLKPSNIMVSAQGVVKVMDFGIAKMLGAPMQLTRSGRKVGSIPFMSPEQIREENADQRSDLYSLGIALFQVATGRVPFDATSEYEVMKAHLEEPPPTPTSLNPALSEKLERVILRAISKRPENRFQNALEMRAALKPEETASDTDDHVVVASSEKTHVDLGGPPSAPKSAYRLRTRVLLGAAVLLTALIAMRFAALRRDSVNESAGVSAPSTAPGTGPKVAVSAPQVSAPVSTAAALPVPDTSVTGLQTQMITPAEPVTNSAPIKAEGQGATPPRQSEQTKVEGKGTEPLGQQADRVGATRTPGHAPKKAAVHAASVPASEPVSVPASSAPQPAPHKYRISVQVKPSGSFRFDDLVWWHESGRLVEGSHRLEVMGAGFPIFRSQFNLRSDTTLLVDLEVTSARFALGDLRVSAKTTTGDFPACQLKINDADAGLLPGLRLPLRSGLYQIELLPPAQFRVDSLQFEGATFPGARARIQVPVASRAFARYFLSPRP